jgi:hypothetical protein
MGVSRRAYGLDALRSEIDERWEGRDVRSDGWIGDAKHRSRPSDHNPNSAGVVQAIDVDEHTDRSERSDEVGRWLWDALLRSQDERIAYVIYEHRMFSSYKSGRGPAWTVGQGRGHTQHLHISLVDDVRLHDSSARWFAHLSALTNGDDTMTPAQESKLDTALSQLAWLRDKTDKTNGAVGRMEAVHGQGLADIGQSMAQMDVDSVADQIVESMGSEVGPQVAAELHRRLAE